MNAYIIGGSPHGNSYGAGCWRVDAETKAKALAALKAVVNHEFVEWDLAILDVFPSTRRRPKVECYVQYRE